MTLQDFKDQVAREWHKESGHFLSPRMRPWASMKIALSKETLDDYHDRAAELHAKARENEAQGAKFRLEWFENGYVAAGGNPGDKCEEAYLKTVNSYK